MSHSAVAQGRVRELHGLTGARFAAAAAVVIGHFGVSAGWPTWMTAYGGAAVAFFFALSGFVLTFNYVDRLPAGDGQALGNFFRARAARIYPVYAVVLLAATLLTLLVCHRDPSEWYGTSTARLAGGWVAALLLLQSYSFNAISAGFWAGPGWSVSCEAFFYAAFPLLLRPIRRLRSPTAVAATALAVWAAFAVTQLGLIAVARHVFHKHDESLMLITYQAPYLRIGEFGVGCLAGLWFIRRGEQPIPSRLAREAAVWGGLAVACTLALLVVHGVLPRIYGQTLLYNPAFAAVILGLTSGPTVLGGVLSGRTMIRLGEASYSLYLVHWLPLLLVIHKVAPTTSSYALFGIASSVGASLLLFSMVEDPCRRLLRGPTAQPALTAPVVQTSAFDASSSTAMACR